MTISVLVIDGNGGAIESITRSIERTDDSVSVVTESIPAVAIERVEGGSVDCVISGHNVETMGGFELLDALDDAQPGLPIVLFPEDGSTALASEALSGPVDYYVTRDDMAAEHLVSAIQRAVASSGSSVTEAHVPARTPLDDDADSGHRQLHEREEDFWGAILEQVTVGVGIYDETGTIVSASRTFAELFDTMPADLLGRRVWEFHSDISPDGFEAYFESITDPDSCEARFDDTRRELVVHDHSSGLLSGSPIDSPVIDVTITPLSLGERKYHILTCQDVTDQKADEEDSRLLEALLNHIPVYLYVKDDDGRHIRVNSRLVAQDADIMGKTDVEVYGEAGREWYEDDMQVIEEGKEVINRVSHDTDSHHYHLASKVPWRDEAREIQGLVGITRDITERKRRERQLEHQNERLRTVADLLSSDVEDLLDIASAHIARAEADHGDETFSSINDGLNRIEILLSDLLTMLEHGRWVETTDTVDLAAVARRCWETTGIERAQIEIRSLDPIDAEEARVEQLFENLFRNAIMHVGEDVTVTVGMLEDGAGFYIADDGPGVPPDERDQIFESGYTDSEDGTGFGLAIVEMIAEAHDWSVSLTAGRNGGARFEFSGVDVAITRGRI